MVKSESVRILVIEDEVKVATHLSRALEAEGHEARVVHDGKVALVEAREGNYDLLVLDVELPIWLVHRHPRQSLAADAPRAGAKCRPRRRPELAVQSPVRKLRKRQRWTLQ